MTQKTWTPRSGGSGGNGGRGAVLEKKESVQTLAVDNDIDDDDFLVGDMEDIQ